MIEDLLLKIKEYSTCKKHHIAAIIVSDNNSVIGIGYNTPIVGSQPCCRREGCPSGSCLELCNAVHAEVVALLDAAHRGMSTNNATMYITNMPCLMCIKIIAQSNIKNIIYYEDYYKPGTSEYNEIMKICEVHNIKIKKSVK